MPDQIATESFPGFVTGIEFSDGRPRKCGNCDDCCPCYDDVTDVKSAGIYVTIRLGDDAARVRFGPATLSYGDAETGAATASEVAARALEEAAESFRPRDSNPCRADAEPSERQAGPDSCVEQCPPAAAHPPRSIGEIELTVDEVRAAIETALGPTWDSAVEAYLDDAARAVLALLPDGSRR